MKKNIFLKLTTLFSLFGIVPIVLSSCASNDNIYYFALDATANEGSYTQFVNDVQQEFNKLKNQDSKYSYIPDIVVKVKTDDDKQDAIEKGSADFAFLTAKTLIDNDFYKQVNPMIQTLTTPFIFDTDMTKHYVDGSENDPLRVIAQNMQQASFGLNYQYPLSTWDTQTGPNYNWNGIRYNAFYDESAPLVNGYRGMIVLSGTTTQINNAITYWDNKDWNNFRNLGIITGNTSSAGNYQLEENLIRTHFNLGTNWTIAEDRNENPSYYDTDTYGTSKMGKDANFVIDFTDEASFAWTNNTSGNGDYTPRTGAQIQILTVTNPAIYDIGVFSQTVSQDVANLFTQAIINLYENNDNLYGEGLGYNGYSKITNFNSEVIQPMEEALG